MMVNKAAQELGRMAKGIPKNYTQAERQRRAFRMRMLNEVRRRKKDERDTTEQGDN
jgi:hypothetical protein